MQATDELGRDGRARGIQQQQAVVHSSNRLKCVGLFHLEDPNPPPAQSGGARAETLFNNNEKSEYYNRMNGRPPGEDEVPRHIIATTRVP